MKEAGYTKQERSLQASMKFWGIFFLLAAGVAAFFPDWILTYMTNIGHTFFGWRGPRPEMTKHVFWLVLAVSLLLVQAYLAFQVVRDPIRNVACAKVIIVAKLCSTLGYLYAVFFLDHFFIYMAGAVVDACFLLALVITYRASIISRPDQSF